MTVFLVRFYVFISGVLVRTSENFTEEFHIPTTIDLIDSSF